jgi:hypothetical protein
LEQVDREQLAALERFNAQLTAAALQLAIVLAAASGFLKQRGAAAERHREVSYTEVRGERPWRVIRLWIREKRQMRMISQKRCDAHMRFRHYISYDRRGSQLNSTVFLGISLPDS